METTAIEPSNEPKATWPSSRNTAQLAEQLVILAEAFGESLTAPRLRIYVEDLEDLAPEQLSMACVRARRELKFFPRISEIRELAGASPESSDDAEARAAWDVLMNFVSRYVQSDVFGNYAPDQGCRSTPMPILSARILDTVRRSGSWRAFKCMTPSDFPFQQKRFFEEFKAWNAVNAVPVARLALPGKPIRALAEGSAKAKPCATDPKPSVCESARPSASVLKEFPNPQQIHERREVLRQQVELLAKQRDGDVHGDIDADSQKQAEGTTAQSGENARRQM
jgi:hypothetical protein